MADSRVAGGLSVFGQVTAEEGMINGANQAPPRRLTPLLGALRDRSSVGLADDVPRALGLRVPDPRVATTGIARIAPKLQGNLQQRRAGRSTWTWAFDVSAIVDLDGDLDGDPTVVDDL